VDFIVRVDVEAGGPASAVARAVACRRGTGLKIGIGADLELGRVDAVVLGDGVGFRDLGKCQDGWGQEAHKRKSAGEESHDERLSGRQKNVVKNKLWMNEGLVCELTAGEMRRHEIGKGR
jgi:hypothetical protein